MTLRRRALVLGTILSVLAVAIAVFLVATSVYDIVLQAYVGLGRLGDIESAAIVGCLLVPVATRLLAVRRYRAAAMIYVLAALLWLVGFFATDTTYNLANAAVIVAILPLPSLALAVLSYVVAAQG